MEWKTKKIYLQTNYKTWNEKHQNESVSFTLSLSKLPYYCWMNVFLFRSTYLSVSLNEIQELIFCQVLNCAGTEFKNSFPWLFLLFIIWRVLKLYLDCLMFACLYVLNQEKTCNHIISCQTTLHWNYFYIPGLVFTQIKLFLKDLE